MTIELYYDERDYEIGGAFYEGPIDLIEEEDEYADLRITENDRRQTS